MLIKSLAVALLCSTAHCMAAQEPVEPGVDTSIHPGDDFFAYANGAWLKSNEIPAGSGRWTARTEINEQTRQKVARLIDSTATAPAGSDARKVADFLAAYLNQSAIDAQGIVPLRPMFERIDGVLDKAALVRLLGSELRADVDPLNWGIYDSAHLLGLSVESGNYGEKNYVAFLLQGGLGLRRRENYLDPSPEAQALLADHQKRIARVLELAGFDRATQRAEAVMALETAIAETHATPEASGDIRNAGNLWTRADFTRRAPGIDWAEFFAAARLANQDAFVVWQPGAIEGAAKLIATQRLDTWKDYLRFHAIDLYADVLPHEFATPEPSAPRAQRAMEVTQQAMRGVLGRLYAERYFPAEQKARVKAIASNVIVASRQRIETASWLTSASKKQALAKLETLYFGVAYPEKWPNYSTLEMSPVDAVGNLRRIAEWSYRNALALTGKPADHTDWWIGPQVAVAVLLFQQNSYNFAAALLQPPKFDPAASDAANYGAIGAIIGHEVCHFIDSLGADYDATGRKTRWWSAEDLAKYQSATEPLVQQFARYRPFPDLPVNGKLTLVENLADLAGLTAAFDAHRRALGARANDKEYARQQDRQFFIGFARAWRAKYRDDALRALVASEDTHAPENYRIATVRNMDAWYEAFSVLPGHRLYLEPARRIRPW